MVELIRNQRLFEASLKEQAGSGGLTATQKRLEKAELGASEKKNFGKFLEVSENQADEKTQDMTHRGVEEDQALTKQQRSSQRTNRSASKQKERESLRGTENSQKLVL